MKVAAIVPAYNEEKTIAVVLRELIRHPSLNEVIVVSDGSRDNTVAVARKAGARVIDLKQNVGKGGAMKQGSLSTDADVLLFIDADLVGLKPAHVEKLLSPVLHGEAEMALGVFGEGRLATDLAQKITPFLSGQRAIKRDVFNSIPDLEAARYGVEVAISQYCRKHGVKTKTVVLQDLSQVMKEEKRGFVKGFAHRMQMYWEIIKSIRVR